MNINLMVKKMVDVRGLHCPMPIVRTVNEIKKVEIGEVIKVLATDPGSKRDFDSWSRKTGNKLLEMSEREGVFTYIIQRRR